MNPLALETRLIDTLRAALPTARIGSLANFVGSANIDKYLPTVIVIPPTAEPTDSDDDAIAEIQTWAIEVAVESTPDRANLDANYQAAGELLGTVMATVNGLNPGNGYSTVRYHGRPEPVEVGGRIHFPVEFTVTFSGVA